MEQWIGSVHSKMAWQTHFFFIWHLSRFGKELFSFKIHLQQRLVGYTKSGIKTYILPNVEESASFSDLRRCPRSSLLINLQSNRFLCAVWKDRKICPETSQIGASFWFFWSLRFFFTLITNNLALTYSLKYDNANKMRQCENIFVFIDLTKSIGSDLGGQCPPPPPAPPQTPPMFPGTMKYSCRTGIFVERKDHLDGLLPQESAHFLFNYQSLLGTHQRGINPVERRRWNAAIALFYSVQDPSRHIWQ